MRNVFLDFKELVRTESSKYSVKNVILFRKNSVLCKCKTPVLRSTERCWTVVTVGFKLLYSKVSLNLNCTGRFQRSRTRGRNVKFGMQCLLPSAAPSRLSLQLNLISRQEKWHPRRSVRLSGTDSVWLIYKQHGGSGTSFQNLWILSLLDRASSW